MKGDAAKERKIRDRMHQLQTMNRVDLRSYYAGCLEVKRLGRELQALRKSRKEGERKKTRR